MNLLGWAGYWFYNAANGDERASLFASWGLLTDAPDVTGLYSRIVGMIGKRFKIMLGG